MLCVPVQHADEFVGLVAIAQSELHPRTVPDASVAPFNLVGHMGLRLTGHEAKEPNRKELSVNQMRGI